MSALRDTMCHMRCAGIRDLHLNTSAIVKRVSESESFIAEKHGIPVAELEPIQSLAPMRKLLDREPEIWFT